MAKSSAKANAGQKAAATKASKKAPATKNASVKSKQKQPSKIKQQDQLPPIIVRGGGSVYVNYDRRVINPTSTSLGYSHTHTSVSATRTLLYVKVLRANGSIKVDPISLDADDQVVVETKPAP